MRSFIWSPLKPDELVMPEVLEEITLNDTASDEIMDVDASYSESQAQVEEKSNDVLIEATVVVAAEDSQCQRYDQIANQEIASLKDEVALLKRQLADQENQRVRNLETDNNFMAGIHRQSIYQRERIVELEEELSELKQKYVECQKRVQEVESHVEQLEFDKDVLQAMVISRDSIIYELEDAGYFAPVGDEPLVTTHFVLEFAGEEEEETVVIESVAPTPPVAENSADLVTVMHRVAYESLIVQVHEEEEEELAALDSADSLKVAESTAEECVIEEVAGARGEEDGAGSQSSQTQKLTEELRQFIGTMRDSKQKKPVSRNRCLCICGIPYPETWKDLKSHLSGIVVDAFPYVVFQSSIEGQKAMEYLQDKKVRVS
jgi:hypothetical protein